MNTINNKRKKDSQERIEKNFVELIQTKDINEISITDICQKAGLNRTTFYSNYIDIYDLADKIRKKLETEVLEFALDENTNQFNITDFIKLFTHIKDNQIFYKTYFKLGFDKSNLFKQYDTTLMNKYFQNTEHIDYHIEFFKAGLNAIIQKWLNSGCKESPEEMENIIKDEYNK